MMNNIRCILSLLVLSFLIAGAEAQQLAFPGAEGFGKYTSGGRGGRVIAVTNTDDSGAGSLREALTTAGKDPITIVFKVSGLIALNTDIRSSRPNMTIAGQTAPGDGICVCNRTVRFSGSNIIIRFMRFRVGDLAKASLSNLDTENQKNVIIDHCSFSWSVEENHTCYDNKWTTVQWCILSEGLYASFNHKGSRSYGSQWGGQYASYHHNLLANNNTRSPRVNGCRAHDTIALCDYRNNVIYNWGASGAVYGGEVQIAAPTAKCNVNWINNYYKPGPATSATRYFAAPSYNAALATGYSKWYFSGNYMSGEKGGMNDNNWLGVNASAAGSASNIQSTTEFTVETVTTQTAADAFVDVVAKAGATLPKRDAVDTRIISEVNGAAPIGSGMYGLKPGTADTVIGKVGPKLGIIDSQTVLGGWPVYTSTTPPADTDADGIPDAWETANGLNPKDASDANKVGPDGYTMLENYLNSLCAASFPQSKTTTKPGKISKN